MRFLLLLIFVMPAYSQIEVKYDKFKDASIVSFDGGRVGIAKFHAYYTFKGERPSEPDYWLMFSASCPRLCFVKERTLIFLADGERIELGRGHYDYNPRAVRDERVIYSITKAQIEALASGRDVSFQLGRFEAELTEKQKKGIKELLSYQIK